jgi:hypothetical protein
MNNALIGGMEEQEIVIVDYDPLWPEKFKKHAAMLSRALGSKALAERQVTSRKSLAAWTTLWISSYYAGAGNAVFPKARQNSSRFCKFFLDVWDPALAALQRRRNIAALHPSDDWRVILTRGSFRT